MTPDEHLQQIMGSIIASLIVQLAVVKAENERLRTERDGAPVTSDGALRGAP